MNDADMVSGSSTAGDSLSAELGLCCRCRTQAEQEREKGNEHYRRGEFALALRCYTRCIGFNRCVVSSPFTLDFHP
jgi:hypothetical protein